MTPRLAKITQGMVILGILKTQMKTTFQNAKDDTIWLTQNVIPFAEGAPNDDLMVETLPDGDVLIGDPELDMQEEIETLSSTQTSQKKFDARELARKGQELIAFYENDEAHDQSGRTL